MSKQKAGLLDKLLTDPMVAAKIATGRTAFLPKLHLSPKDVNSQSQVDFLSTQDRSPKGSTRRKTNMFTIGTIDETTNTILSARNSLGPMRRGSPLVSPTTTPRQTMKTPKSQSTNSHLPKISSKADTAANESRRESRMTNITVKQRKTPYDRSFRLEPVSQLLDKRQNAHYVGRYYKQMVNNRIFESKNPSPMLKAEQKALQRYQSPAPPPRKPAGDSLYYFRSKSLLNQSNFPPISPRLQLLQEKAEIDEEVRAITNMSQNHNGNVDTDEQRQKKINNFSQMWNDSMVSDHMRERSTDLPPDSSHVGQGLSHHLGLIANIAASQEIKSDVKRSLRVQDPVAGNSVITQLSKQLKQSARNQIIGKIAEVNAKYTRQHRKRALVGQEWVDDTKDIVISEQDKASEADSLANQSCFDALKKDLNSFGIQQFLDKDKEAKKTTDKFQLGPANQQKQSQKSKKTKKYEYVDEARHEIIYGQPPHHDEQVASEVNKLKAKIKLKSVKQYQEDVQMKKEELARMLEVPVEMKDKLGRVMVKAFPRMRSKRVPSGPRRPVKRPPLKRKSSFTAQFEHDYTASLPYSESLANSKLDKHALDKMKEWGNWPIQEMLLGKSETEKFRLTIDTLMKEVYQDNYVKEWATYRQELDAPYNTISSGGDIDLNESESEEDEIKLQADLNKPEQAQKSFNKSLLNTQPFRLESLQYFPYKQKEGDIPVKLLKVPRLDWILKAQEALAEQQKEKLWSREFLQDVFEYYCLQMKAAPFDLMKYMDDRSASNIALRFTNYPLDDNSTKALALTLPYIHDIKEFEIKNNKINDQLSGALLFACFCNPSIIRLNFNYQYLRSVFAKTFRQLVALQPDRLKLLSTMGSINNADHTEPICRSLNMMKSLNIVNLAGCQLSLRVSQVLSNFITNSNAIRDLDVSHCKLSWQSSRYIIDALNRNICIRNFNVSYNDLSSTDFEFAIKLASMITRHPTMMHLNIANTNFKREEVIFLGMSLSISKTILSLHMTAQGLPYYERIFLRAVIAARVGFQFRNLSVKKDVRGNRERNQVLSQAIPDVQETEMQAYLDKFRDLDERREGLDFEIQDMLTELDTTDTWKSIAENAMVEDLPQESKVGKLIQKIIARQREIEDQGKHFNSLYDSKNATMKDQMELLNGLKEITQYNFDQDGKLNVQAKPVEAHLQDQFHKQKELKVERQRVKQEREAQKEVKERSAGELALMFMGINQASYELLVENPMTGYMNEIVFSRILGHDDIEQVGFWTDSTQCWVCQKWTKTVISYQFEDKAIFKQKVDKIETLQHAIQKCVDIGLETADKQAQEIELIKKDELRAQALDDNDSFIEEVPEEMEQSKMTYPRGFGSGMKMTGLKSFQHGSEYISQPGNTKRNTVKFADLGSIRQTRQGETIFMKTGDTRLKQEDTVEEESEIEEDINEEDTVDPSNIGDTKSQATTVIMEVEKPFLQKFDNTNPFLPSKTKAKYVQQDVIPEKYIVRKEFGELHLADTFNEKEWNKQTLSSRIDKDKKRKIKIRPLSSHKNTSSNQKSSNMSNLSKHYAHNHGDETTTLDPVQALTSCLSVREIPARKRGEPMIIEKIIYYEGMVYKIEEEVYSDADHSSVYTSEDSFESDPGMQGRFAKQNSVPGTENMTNSDSKGRSLKAPSRMLDHLKISTPATQPGGLLRPLTGVNSNMNSDDSSILEAPAVEAELKPYMADPNKSEPTGISASNALRGASTMVPSAIGPQTPALQRQTTIDNTVELQTSGTPALQGQTTIGGGEIKKQNSEIKRQDTVRTLVGSKPGSKPKEQPKSILKKKQKSDKSAEIKKPKALFTNSEGLNTKQQGYEPKILPKHYKDELSRKRLKMINEQQPEETKKDRKKDDKEAEERRDLIHGKDIKLVASFNDWMPLQMKTYRTLTLEKYSLLDEEGILEHAYLYDDNQLLHANFIPPGYHYFFYAQEEGQIFLSPKYEVVRYKKTNVFLNRIYVKPRLEEMNYQVFVAKTKGEDEEVFNKDKSVFAEFNEDTDQSLQECFDEDMKFSKLQRLFKKDPSGFEDIKELLFDNYVALLNIFNYYSGMSDYPVMGWNDVNSFGHMTGLLEDNMIKMSDYDLIFIGTNVVNHTYTKSEERTLQRYEFLEFMVRLAMYRFVEQHNITKNKVTAIQMLLDEYIYPNCNKIDGDMFRRYYCYNVKTNEILSRNTTQIKKLYESFTHSQKRWITLEECRHFVRKLDLDISELFIGAIYASSMMTIVDTIRDPVRVNKMSYVEFLVFLCRVAHSHYADGPYAKEPLSNKLDHLIDPYLDFINLTPVFKLGELFVQEKKENVKQYKRKKRMLLRQAIKEAGGGPPVSVKLQQEAKDIMMKMSKAGMDIDQIEIGDIDEQSESEEEPKPQEPEAPVRSSSRAGSEDGQDHENKQSDGSKDKPEIASDTKGTGEKNQPEIAGNTLKTGDTDSKQAEKNVDKK